MGEQLREAISVAADEIENETPKERKKRLRREFEARQEHKQLMQDVEAEKQRRAKAKNAAGKGIKGYSGGGKSQAYMDEMGI